MKIFNSHILVIFFTTLVFFSNSAFSIDLFGSDKEDVIWKVGTNVYLKYADQGKSKAGKNDHPVELEEERLRKALQLLTIQQVDYTDSGEESLSVFTQAQINMLSKHVARGLIKAGPDQDIVFVLKKNAKRFMGLKTTQFFVAGRVFYKNDKLNIIIGDYDRARQQGYEAAYDPTHMGIVAYNFNHGKRSKSAKEFKAPLADVKGIMLKEKRRSDWFVIDLKDAASAYDLQIATREQRERQGKREELRAILGDGASGLSAKERAQMSKERREMRAEMARMRKEMSEMPGGNKGASSQSLEARLRTLEQLKKKGLISDKEYTVKRREVLNDI